jgi:hypothetical protein
VEAFVDGVEKLFAYVGFDIRAIWGVVPCDVSGSISAGI